MRIKLTPPQLDALRVGDYLPEEQTVLTLRDGVLYYDDKQEAWRLLVDACNAADEWATYWRERKEPTLAAHCARECRSLGALSSKVLK